MDLPTTKTFSILVAEDEAIVAIDIKTRLQRFGYQIAAVVASGADAIRQAEALHPDLVVMDIMLQGEIDGIMAAEWISTTLSIPILFLTAYSAEVMIERAKDVGPYGYLLKPFDEQQLHIAIEMALAKHRKEKDRRPPRA